MRINAKKGKLEPFLEVGFSLIKCEVPDRVLLPCDMPLSDPGERPAR
ncbi:MAG TPA: hypothetical protein QF623_03910 [SAR324 cluster bacterium]|nr:hypothetical protein [SAR324 cluster bacterium]HJL86252.1 hypothetical protein [SAR324 cluster bacterium]